MSEKLVSGTKSNKKQRTIYACMGQQFSLGFIGHHGHNWTAQKKRPTVVTKW